MSTFEEIQPTELPQFTPDMQDRSDIIRETEKYVLDRDDVDLYAELIVLTNNLPNNKRNNLQLLTMGFCLSEDQRNIPITNIQDFMDRRQDERQPFLAIAKRMLDVPEEEILELLPKEETVHKLLTQLQATYTIENYNWAIIFAKLCGMRAFIDNVRALAFMTEKYELQDKIKKAMADFDSDVQIVVNHLGINYLEFPPELAFTSLVRAGETDYIQMQCPEIELDATWHTIPICAHNASLGIPLDLEEDEESIAEEAFVNTIFDAVTSEELEEFGLDHAHLLAKNRPKA